MEAIDARDPAPEVPLNKLLREPLSWAAAATFVGAAVGLAGTSRLAAWFGSLGDSPSPPSALVWLLPPAGELLAAVSLIGVLPLLGGRQAARVARLLGVPLVLLLLVTLAGNAAWQFGWIPRGGATASGGASAFYGAVLALGLCLPPLAVLPFAAAAFLARDVRVGTLLLGIFALAVPHLLVRQIVFGGTFGEVPQDVAASVLLGGIGVGVSLPEASFWGLFGVVLFRAARRRVRGEEFRAREEANARAARRLYVEALGAGDASVVDELVSEGFRDLKSGARGRLGMERLLADLRASYPDLAVSVVGQEAEGDLVRTRLVLSGTDRGRGVLWYPPTGRSVSFEAEFSDRFRKGELVEHAGRADTAGLLQQLGHHDEEGRPGSGPNF